MDVSIATDMTAGIRLQMGSLYNYLDANLPGSLGVIVLG
jgi:hypothetical protein